MRNALLYLPKEQVEKYVEINKRMKPEDLVYGKQNFNRYGTIISFISNFLTEVTDTDEMYKMLNEFKNEINEFKSDYLVGQDEKIDDVIENASIVYNIHFFLKNIQGKTNQDFSITRNYCRERESKIKKTKSRSQRLI